MPTVGCLVSASCIVSSLVFLGSDCKNGSVRVYDGSSVTSPLLATLCGWRASEIIYSTANEMYIVLDNLQLHEDETIEMTYETLGEAVLPR